MAVLLTLPPAWQGLRNHTLKIPAAYTGDTTITNAPVQGGELTFMLTKK